MELMQQQVETSIDRVLMSLDTRYWIKNALIAALAEDCDSALSGLELLARLLRERRQATGVAHAADIGRRRN